MSVAFGASAATSRDEDCGWCRSLPSNTSLTLARWSGDAYLLTSQKLLQDQYEREFGDALQLVKGRENYLCERYAPPARVTTTHGLCRRPRAPFCQCPYARAKLAAQNGPIFCTNTAYFLTLRQWQREQLRRRRVLVVDEAHNLEAQLVRVFTVAFAPDQMTKWFGGPLPRLGSADEYRILFEDDVSRLDMALALYPLTPQELALLGERDLLESALARLHFFLDAEDTEWVVRYPTEISAALSPAPTRLVPRSGGAGAARRQGAAIVTYSSAKDPCVGRPPYGTVWPAWVTTTATLPALTVTTQRGANETNRWTTWIPSGSARARRSATRPRGRSSG
ncbi:MAG: hypothetical protein HYY95_02630 [Candidatus Rokubacteria bacterium]|nr:hypothetical protein [Candidatus Rokubacteria bacterium]